MKRGIVVTTSEYTKEFLRDCLDSIPDTYPMLVISNNNYFPGMEYIKQRMQPLKIITTDYNGYETSGILMGANNFDEFIHIPDTCKILKPELIDILFAHNGSISLSSLFFSCIGKYVSEIIKQVGIEKTIGKHAAINFERHWHEKYINADPNYKRFEPELLIETDIFDTIHGQRRMIIDNGWIVKYKGTYGGNAGSVKD